MLRCISAAARVNSNPAKGVHVIHDDAGKVGAVQVEYKDPLTGKAKTANIPYDNRQMPIMDDVAKYTTNIDTSLGYEAQMRQATRDLRQAIQENKVDANQFTEKQLKDIWSGMFSIDRYTWHHNAQAALNNMQLVPRYVHGSVNHIGQGALNEGR